MKRKTETTKAGAAAQVELHPIAVKTAEKYAASREKFMRETHIYLARYADLEGKFFVEMNKCLATLPTPASYEAAFAKYNNRTGDAELDEDTNEALKEGTIKEVFVGFPNAKPILKQLDILRDEATILGRVLDEIHDSVALTLPAFKGGGAVLVAKSTLLPYLRMLSQNTMKPKELRLDFLKALVSIEQGLIQCPQSPTAQQLYTIVVGRTWKSIQAQWEEMKATVCNTFIYLRKNQKAIEQTSIGGKHTAGAM